MYFYNNADKINMWKQVCKIVCLILFIWLHYAFVMEELAVHLYTTSEKESLHHMANIKNCGIKKTVILQEELSEIFENNSRITVLNLGQDFCNRLRLSQVFSVLQSDNFLAVEAVNTAEGTIKENSYHVANMQENGAVSTSCKDFSSTICVNEMLTKSLKPSLKEFPYCQQVAWTKFAAVLQSKTSPNSILRMPRDMMFHLCGDKDKKCPFARVAGACNNLLITEYKGCSLDQFHFQPLRLRIKIALNLLKAMEWLDNPNREFNVLLNDLANVNFICDANGNTIILDPTKILLTTKDYIFNDNSMDWFCAAGLSQNFYEAAQLLLSTSTVEQSAADIMQPNWRITNLLHGLDKVLRELNQEPLQKLPSRAQWMKFSSKKRSNLRRQMNLQLQNIVFALNKNGENARHSSLFSICVTLDICVLIFTLIFGWLRPRFLILCNEICEVDYDEHYSKHYKSYR